MSEKTERELLRDLKSLQNLLLVGRDGEPLVIASELETGTDGFGDTWARFEVCNPDGRSRYGIHVTITPLRVAAAIGQAREQDGKGE